MKYNKALVSFAIRRLRLDAICALIIGIVVLLASISAVRIGLNDSYSTEMDRIILYVAAAVGLIVSVYPLSLSWKFLQARKEILARQEFDFNLAQLVSEGGDFFIDRLIGSPSRDKTTGEKVFTALIREPEEGKVG